MREIGKIGKNKNMCFTTRLIFFSFPGSQGVVFLSFCQVVRIGNRSPEWWWLKDKEGKSPRKQNKGKSEDQSEDLRQNKQHSWLAQFTQGRPRGEEKTYKKRSQRAGDLSLSLSLIPTHWHTPLLSSLCVFGSACPHALKMDFPAIF